MQNDIIRRILIVDDDITTLVDTQYLFANAGFKAEVCVADNLEEGMHQLKQWAAQGHAADIVDSDHFVAIGMLEDFKPGRGVNGGYNGVSAVRHVMQWAQEQPEHVRPRKYFIHSKDPYGVEVEPWLSKEVDIYNSSELHQVERFGMDIINIPAGNIALREYLNRAFGASYPLNEHEAKLMQATRTEQPQSLDVREYLDILDSDILRYEHKRAESILAKLNLGGLADMFGDRVDTQRAREMGYDVYGDQLDFARGTGGAVVGALAFSKEKAVELRKQGKKAILVLEEFTPQHTALLSVADGIILLGKGTEHLEVVTANHGIPAIMDNSWGTRLRFGQDEKGRLLSNVPNNLLEAGALIYREGDEVTISKGGVTSGSMGEEVMTGRMIKGALPLIHPDPLELSEDDPVATLSVLAGWADAARERKGGMKLLANADTPAQVEAAVRLGAEGIGLMRTEHMFFAEERLAALQSVLLQEGIDDSFKILKESQKKDFADVFRIVNPGDGFPITIRLLDAPPQEFLDSQQIAALEARVGKENTRGVQLAARTPGLYAMQAEAVFEAMQESGYEGEVSIMVPLVRTIEELRAVKEEIEAVAERKGMQDAYTLRAMIETPEAARAAGEIARMVGGISFGTNDLTAELMQVERKDIAGTRAWMAKHRHVGKSPQLTLAKPVIVMMEEAVLAARQANPCIDIGICGHQVAADQPSIAHCQKMELDSISVPATPAYFIPSQIMAGQAALLHPRAEREEPVRDIEPRGSYAAEAAKKNISRQRGG